MANDQRLLTLVGCIGGIVLEFDEHVRYVNAWADDPNLLAMPAQALIGQTINEVLGEVAGERFTTIIQRVFASGEVDRLEYPIDLQSGRRWFFADVKRVGTAETGMTVVLFARDITDRKATEEALVRSEERFRLAARATSDVLWDWDLVSSWAEWSAAMTSVLGYPELGGPDTWWKQRVHPDDQHRVLSLIDATLAGTDSAWSDTYRFRHADGTYREVVNRAFIVRERTGQAVRMVGSLTDVTQINQLRGRLLQSDRLAALGLLAAGVGHEINNPLTYVIGNIEAALELDASEELRSTLEDARDGACRIAEIVKTLKLFSRADDTKFAPLDLHAVLERAIRMAENEIRHRARLVRSFGPIPFVHSTESQVAQVCLNLLINAAQALSSGSREDHEIRISTSVDRSGRVAVVFEDTGTGISPEHLTRVFDPFFTTKSIGVGTGLGLTICHDIVKKLGGEIMISSELGVGTKVTVLLPAVDALAS
ncbi:MAG: ATP-binding protein [Myxococcota bacterium]|nr:ATP-binding protein [Myxococcota bacterium]